MPTKRFPYWRNYLFKSTRLHLMVTKTVDGIITIDWAKFFCLLKMIIYWSGPVKGTSWCTASSRVTIRKVHWVPVVKSICLDPTNILLKSLFSNLLLFLNTKYSSVSQVLVWLTKAGLVLFSSLFGIFQMALSRFMIWQYSTSQQSPQLPNQEEPHTFVWMLKYTHIHRIMKN